MGECEVIGSVRASSSKDCYLCGTQGEVLYRDLDDRLFHVPGTWNINRCPNEKCGLLWLDPKPFAEDLGKLYTTYYTHAKEESASGKSGRQNLFIRVLKNCYLSLLKISGLYGRKQKLRRMYLDDYPPGKLLEVGCGTGERLVMLKKLGWDVQGQEIDPKAASVARASCDAVIHAGELTTLSLPGETFDAVIMSHVIEHVYDPISLLRECNRLLKKGGQLVLITPNAQGLLHKKFKIRWMDLDPPRHLYLFSMQTLKELVHQADYVQSEVWTTSLTTIASAVGSYEIRATGRHDMQQQAAFSIQFRGFVMQLFAQCMIIFKRMSGEACIIRAFKENGTTQEKSVGNTGDCS